MTLRIAWAGPWSEKSAIAAFGVDVIGALWAAGHHVEVFRTEAGEGEALAPLPAPGPVHPPQCLTPALLGGAFDAVFVNLGNYYAFHGSALAILRATPAIVIVHDRVMDGFRAGWAAAGQAADPGYAGLVAPGSVEDGTLLRRLAGLSVGAVVHARHYADEIGAACPGPVDTIPLSMTFRNICRGLPPAPQGARLVVVTIGHLNPNKRVDQVIRALGASPILRERARYVLIGPVESRYCEQLLSLARRVGAPAPTFTGQIPDRELRSHLAGADVVCCLRDPVTEGGSASVILALRSGRPTLVCDHGSYADLPDDVVLKCPPGREAAHIVHYLEMLLDNPTVGRAIGGRAQAYANRSFAPKAYATALIGLAERVARASPRLLATQKIGGALRNLGLPSDEPAVQNAMRGLTSLLRVGEEGSGDGDAAGQSIHDRPRVG